MSAKPKGETCKTWKFTGMFEKSVKADLDYLNALYFQGHSRPETFALAIRTLARQERAKVQRLAEQEQERQRALFALLNESTCSEPLLLIGTATRERERENA